MTVQTVVVIIHDVSMHRSVRMYVRGNMAHMSLMGVTMMVVATIADKGQ